MIIKSVELINFRNHAKYKLVCRENTALILGKNGFGKTSILEAIYILMRGKSFRATDKEILRRGEEFYRAVLEYENGEVVTVTFDGKEKFFTIIDKKTRRLPNKNKYPVVLFLPSDLNLVSAAPGRRRDYFDKMFGQLNEGYYNSLLRYEKALKQRNELLKKEGVRAEAVFSWNILLAKYGVEIYLRRKKFLEEINRQITKVYRSIAENKDKIEVILKSKLEEIKGREDLYLKRLDGDFMRDTILGHTGFGIHLDDFQFIFNEELADGSASRGEVRSMILALKFIEAEMIYQKLGCRSVVLLDDVFSELDNKRQKCLVKNFKDNQIIITSTNDINNK